MQGHKKVTLRNVRVHGFWCGIWATDASGLTVEDTDASDPYVIKVKAPDFSTDVSGTLLAAAWDVTAFPRTVDPREDLVGWYKESRSDKALTGRTDRLTLKFTFGGPSD